MPGLALKTERFADLAVLIAALSPQPAACAPRRIFRGQLEPEPQIG